LRIDEGGDFCLRNVILAFGTHLDLRAKLKNKWWDTTGSHHLGKPHIFVTGKHRLRNSCSQPASKKKDQDDYDDESHSAAWVISPGPTVRPSRQRAQQHQDQHDEKNCVHETLLDFRS
jgi:hypothetical protein